jgi:hypothetical protein
MRHERNVPILVHFPDGRTPLWRAKVILVENIRRKPREA